MKYGDVIRMRRGALGMNQTELAEKTGVSRNTVAGWETGHSRPDLDTVPRLCDALRLPISRFFGREGRLTESERRLLEVFRMMEEGDREAILWQMEALQQQRDRQRIREEENRMPQVITLFRNELGAAAGFGAALGETQGEPMTLLKDSETEQADEVITVCGASMEPTFTDGDRVLVQHTGRLRYGEIGIFLVENEGYIKEYQADGLHSHNPAYPTMTFREDQHVRCLGRVIGKLKESQIPTEAQMKMINGRP